MEKYLNNQILLLLLLNFLIIYEFIKKNFGIISCKIKAVLLACQRTFTSLIRKSKYNKKIYTINKIKIKFYKNRLSRWFSISRSVELQHKGRLSSWFVYVNKKYS